MLIDFKFSNYLSFKDEQSLSMIASSDRSLIQNTIAHESLGKRKLLRSAVVYGPNASGKSNLMNAIWFVKWFVEGSAERGEREPIGKRSFLLDDETRDKKSEFEVHFIHGEVRYRYGFSVDSRIVHDEWLIAYPKGSPQVWFERHHNPDTEEPSWKFGYHLKGEKKRLAAITRPDVLFVSVASKFGHEQLSNVYEWFSYHLRVIYPTIGVDQGLLDFSSRKYLTDVEMAAKIRRFLALADLGIVDAEVDELDFSEDAIESMGEEFPSSLREALSKRTIYDVNFLHRARGNQSFPIHWGMESLGTQRLFTLSGPWIHTLDEGFTLVVDELHASLHPNQVKAMIRMFHDSDINANGAQLIFNTHAVSLLDPELFRRDQIWLVEKDQEGASHLYPLTDFSPRKGEALMKGYLFGRYGAVPFLSDFIEHYKEDAKEST